MIILLVAISIGHENVSNTLRNELEGLEKLLVFIESLGVILEVDYIAIFILSYLLEDHLYIHVGSLSYLGCDCHVSD